MCALVTVIQTCALPISDAFSVGSGAIDGRPAVVVLQDFGFMGGAKGMAVGTAFCAGAERALPRKCASVVVTAAGGARLQEGILSLMQLPKATGVTGRLNPARLVYTVAVGRASVEVRRGSYVVVVGG